MKILAVAFAYNERPYIESFIDYYRDQGCDLFVLNNASTDGTTEILERRKVNSRILHTRGMFHLLHLQQGLIDEIRNVKPDWIVYCGIDIRIVFEKTIRKELENAEGNLIGVKYYNVYNTGERFALPLHNNYFFGRDLKRLYLIARYAEPLRFDADSIHIPDKKIIESTGIFLNYGNCKPAAEREDTYRRRMKAWKAGLDPNYGVHYNEGHALRWRWDRDSLIDLRHTEYWPLIRKIKY